MTDSDHLDLGITILDNILELDDLFNRRCMGRCNRQQGAAQE